MIIIKTTNGKQYQPQTQNQMETKELNSAVTKLFNKAKKLSKVKKVNDEYYKKLEEFKRDCLKLHNIVGAYEYMTDKNALKMASICSTHRFVEPWNMLMKLSRRT